MRSVSGNGYPLRAGEAQREGHRGQRARLHLPVDETHETVDRVRAILVGERHLIVEAIPPVSSTGDATGKRDQDVALPSLLGGCAAVAGHHRIALPGDAAQAGTAHGDHGGPVAGDELEFRICSHVHQCIEVGAGLPSSFTRRRHPAPAAWRTRQACRR